MDERLVGPSRLSWDRHGLAADADEIRHWRAEHPNLGKRRIHPLLLRFCRRRLRCPAVITIGRLTADAGGLRAVPPRSEDRREHPQPPKPRKPRGFRARCLALLGGAAGRPRESVTVA